MGVTGIGGTGSIDPSAVESGHTTVDPSTTASTTAAPARGSAPASRVSASPPPSLSGVRYSEAVLQDVMTAYGLTDASALLDAALVRDDGNRYLRRSELEAAAEALASGGSAPDASGVDPRSYRFSAAVLDRVMTEHGLTDAAALIAAAAGGDDGNRYLNRSELEAGAKRLTGRAAELGIVSDIDKTVLPPTPPGTTGHPAPYPGVTTLYRALDTGIGGSQPGDVHFVTARTEAKLEDVPDWMDAHGVPRASIDTGIDAFHLAQEEKVRDITRLLEENPGQTFVLFGDSSHRDPEVYKEILARFPDRISAAIIHKVTRTVSPGRVDGLALVDDYAQAAAHLLSKGVIDEPTARAVMEAAQLEGLDITDAEMDRLIAEAQA